MLQLKALHYFKIDLYDFKLIDGVIKNEWFSDFDFA